MLVFFLHGVATRDVEYSRQLQLLLKDELIQRNQALPHFYSGFWGNVLKQTDQIWNWVHQDLQSLKAACPSANVQDVFRYREFRENFISQFFGDFLAYFNTDRGWDIRDTLADQLYKFLKHHEGEQELHLVTHSLGAVILWDVLFSDRFAPDDPAHTFRSLLTPSPQSFHCPRATLSSITTMGSPILLLNLMLNISPATIEAFINQQHCKSLRWLNILHASDVIAYPLRASLQPQLSSAFFLRDKYIWADANLAEKAARTFGQNHTAMALAATDAHCAYWKSRGTARLIAHNLLNDRAAIDTETLDLE